MANKPSRKLTIQLDYGDTDQLGMERLIFFSDAVFAIAITLLSLEIRLPEGIDAFSDAALYSQLFGIWQKYLAFIISFMVIGTLWIGHHRKFRFIKRYDSPLLLLNLILLMVVAFIPFPSSVLSTYSNRTATNFYALVMILASILGSAIWWYATSRGLIDAPLDKKNAPAFVNHPARDSIDLFGFHGYRIYRSGCKQAHLDINHPCIDLYEPVLAGLTWGHVG